MNLMNGSLRGKLYETSPSEQISSRAKEEDRTYKIAFEGDLRETTLANRNYVEVKRN
jgi:hypothetical protein